MDNLINEYVETEFFEEKDTYFGYFENLDKIIFVFSKIKCESNVNEISKIVVSYIVKKLMQTTDYSIKNLKGIIKELKLYLHENKIDDLDSLCILVTDLYTFSAILLGSISLKYVVNGNEEFETKENSICLGGLNDNIEAYIIENTKLSANAVIQLSFNKQIKLTIKFLKILQKKAETVKNKVNFKILLVIFILLFLIINICINTFKIKKYNKNISKINNDLTVYIKHLEVQNINIEISNLEKIYDEIESKRFLIIPKKNEISYRNNIARLKLLRQDVQILKEIKDKMKLAKTCVIKNNFSLAKELYKAIIDANTTILNLDEIKKEARNNIFMIEELENVAELEINAEKLYEDYKIQSSKDLYIKILEIYKKHNKNQDEINEKIKKCDELLDKIREKINLMIIESELQMSKDTSKVMKIYLELRKNYEALNDELNIKNISEKISSLEANNNMDKTRAISLREEAYSYAENKNYKNSIECMLEANKIFAKLRLEKELEVNNRHIRKMKNLMHTEYKRIYAKNNRKDLSVGDRKNRIMRSINLCIKKGDSYINEDKYNDAIIEYNRALDFCKEISYTGDVVEKLKKKLSYAIRKNNKESFWKRIWK